MTLYKIIKIRFFFVTGGPSRNRSAAGMAMEMFEQHQGTHILQVGGDSDTDI